MNHTILNKRRAGFLVPVYALRREGDFGIGDTAALRGAVDFCAENGFEVLQILPIHDTHGDHSPYCPISSKALSPALLTLTAEEVPGLTPAMLSEAAPEEWLAELRVGNVSREAVHPLKTDLLIAASEAFLKLPPSDPLRAEFEDFKKTHADWLPAYTLFRLLIREYEGNTRWADWRPEHRSLDGAETWLGSSSAKDKLQATREAFAYIQWVGWRQWRSVKAYAEEHQVLLMGEICFGVSLYSADVWAQPELFDTEWFLGSPPLAHFDTSKDSERWGQNWGFPAFRWESHRAAGFQWLRGRARWAAEFFHGCRLDHLRGYFRTYQFPWGGGARHVEFSNLSDTEAALMTGGKLPRFVPAADSDPEGRKTNEALGKELVAQFREAAPDLDFVAEIMGDLPEYMSRTLEELQLASLVFPQLHLEATRSIYARDTFRELSLVTYANHDNAPLAMRYLHLREQAELDPAGSAARDLEALLNFATAGREAPEVLDDSLLRGLQLALFSTHCRLAVLMCSDLFGIPLRFNLPGSYGKGTWSDRLPIPLAQFATDPTYGPRLQSVRGMIRETGRYES